MKHLYFFLLLLCFPFFADAEPTKPSFDCAKSHSPVEKLICGDEELRYLDSRMEFYFNRAKEGLSEEARKKLQDEQHSWLEKRESECDITAQLLSGNDTKAIDTAKEYLSSYYRDRNYTLFLQKESDPATTWNVNVTHSLDFLDFSAEGRLSKKQIAFLMTLPVWEIMHVTDGRGANTTTANQHINTCQDYYNDGVDYGGAPYGYIDNFTAFCQALQLLSKAQEPSGKKVAVKKGALGNDEFGKIYPLPFHEDISFTEIARADFDGSGDESVLVTYIVGSGDSGKSIVRGATLIKNLAKEKKRHFSDIYKE